MKSILCLLALIAISSPLYLPGAIPERLWEFPVASASAYELPSTSPSIGADGTIYFTAGSVLYAVTNGNQKWMLDGRGSAALSPFVSADGNIFVYFVRGTQNLSPFTNSLSTISPAGTVVSQVDVSVGFEAVSGQIAMAQNRSVYTGNGSRHINSSGGRLISINPTSRKAVFDTAAAVGCGNIASIVVDKDDTIYFGTDDYSSCTRQELFAVTSGGILKWKASLNFDCSPIAIGSDGVVYVGAKNDNKLNAFNTDGSVRWLFTSTNQDARFIASPVISPSGIAYVGSTDGQMYCINTNGRALWAFDARAAIQSGAVISSTGSIFFGAVRTIFSVAPNGAKLWEFEVSGAVKSASPILSAEGVLLRNYGDRIISFEGI